MSWTIRVSSSGFAQRGNSEVMSTVATSRIGIDRFHTVVQLAAQAPTGRTTSDDAERIVQKVISALLS